MKRPLQIAFHGIDHSEALEVRVREKVAKLEQFFDHITSCRVTIEPDHNKPNLRKEFNVRIDLTVPGSELVVRQLPNNDVYVALKEAFEAMERQLKDYVGRLREDRSAARA